jgi:hypothetical protein
MLRYAILASLVWSASAQSIDAFHLPPKTVFDTSMPRFPNVWFYVDASLAASHKGAVDLVTQGLRNALRLPEYYPPFDNPEACDFEVRVEHLQPWIERTQRNLQHAHAFHLRYYYSALAAKKLDKVKLDRGGRAKEFYRLATSVHYEVEHANPHHADVEHCPICGRMGEYGEVKGNLVEQVHDPLGLELLLKGTIRGVTVHHEDWEKRRFGSVESLSAYRVTSFVFPGQTGDRNTYRIGVVLLEPR